MTIKGNQHGPFAQALRAGVLAGASGERNRAAILEVLVEAGADLSTSTGLPIRLVCSPSAIDTPECAIVLVCDGQRKVNPLPLCYFRLPVTGMATITPLRPGEKPIDVPDADAMAGALREILSDPAVAILVVKYLEFR